MIKKQKTLIIIFVILFALLCAAYFIFIRPLLASEAPELPKLDLLPGEEMISPQIANFYIFSPLSRSSIQSIEVQNEHGTYEIYRDSTDTFQLKDYEGIQFESNAFASLIVSAGTPTAMSRVGVDLTNEELENYGLTEPQAKWTVTSTAGDRYTMLVGDGLITEGGYYVMLEGRNAVYIAGTAIAETILCPPSAIIAPILTAGMSQNDYFYVDEFTIWHGEELFVHTRRVPDSEKQNPDAIIEVALLYPSTEIDGEASYYKINENLYLEVLYSLMTLEASSVVEFLPDEDTSKLYGLDEPAYTVAYSFKGVAFYIFVSELQDDGYYYATSNLFGYTTICRVAPDSLYWLERDQFNWIFQSPFYEYITTISRLTVQGEGVDVDFRLTHGKDADGNNTLDVVEVNSDTSISNANIKNFREYYKTIINVANKQYADLSDEDVAALTSDDSKLVMTMTYENLKGESRVYKFYKYYETSTGEISTGKIFATVDGIGEFYTSNDLVNKVLDSSKRVIAGLDIDPYGQK